MLQRSASARRHQPQGMIILYEDRDILVVDKSPGLLTISTEKGEDRTVHHRLMDYVRKGNSKSTNRVFIVHRLDRDVSGVLVFARTPQAKDFLQERWDEAEKKYVAVVHGKLPDKEGTITSYLAENEAHFMYSTPHASKGKLSHTAYKVLKETRVFSLVEINLLTGRKNQIRVHMMETGNSIVGDKKYGEKDRDHKRLALHALSLSFPHPFTGKQVHFETGIPEYFNRLVSGAGNYAKAVQDHVHDDHEHDSMPDCAVLPEREKRAGATKDRVIAGRLPTKQSRERGHAKAGNNHLQDNHKRDSVSDRAAPPEREKRAGATKDRVIARRPPTKQSRERGNTAKSKRGENERVEQPKSIVHVDDVHRGPGEGHSRSGVRAGISRAVSDRTRRAPRTSRTKRGR